MHRCALHGLQRPAQPSNSVSSTRAHVAQTKVYQMGGELSQVTWQKFLSQLKNGFCMFSWTCKFWVLPRLGDLRWRCGVHSAVLNGTNATQRPPGDFLIGRFPSTKALPTQWHACQPEHVMVQAQCSSTTTCAVRTACENTKMRPHTILHNTDLLLVRA